MSHFLVGVIVEKVEDVSELLAPYQENNMCDCPEEYLEFVKCPEDDIAEFEDHKEDYETLSDFMSDYHGYKWDDDEKSYGYWENPNAKWDWYVIGGRWSNMLKNKLNERVDYAKLKDIDWEGMLIESRKNSEETWIRCQDDKMERLFAGIREEDTLDSYVERNSEFTTYAVITPDGEWHSSGEMGWFGISSETHEEKDIWRENFYERFIKNGDKELILVMVDCHI